VTPSVQRYSAKLLALKDWLLQEAKQSQANGSRQIKV
jgi:hypothetical protein